MGVQSWQSAQYASGSSFAGMRRDGVTDGIGSTTGGDGGSATTAVSCSTSGSGVRLRTMRNKFQFNFTGLSGMITPFRDGGDGIFSLL